MKAMILAAGLGTRLHPLTEDRPKALVQVAGHTLLEITLRRLREFGIREVIINVHHFADMIAEYLRENDNFGMRIELSREEVLLDTGGGLKKAAWFFLEDSRHATSHAPGHLPGPEEDPFLLHNVDVISTIDFEQMVEFHRENQALATLAVQDRETSRYLLFDGQGQLCGRQAGREPAEMARSSGQVQALAFSGVHVISARFLAMITEQGVFSIIESYLRLAGQGEKILAFRADKYYWRDLGRPENVTQATADAERQLVRL
ncbi:MAG: NDP-sugar synthase [Candidatus Sulfotelmatobacter sp.]